MEPFQLPHPVFRAASHEDPPIIIDDTGSLCVETTDAVLDGNKLTGATKNSLTVASFDQKGNFTAMAFGPIESLTVVLGKSGQELGTIRCNIAPKLEMDCDGIKRVDGGTLGRTKYKVDVYDGQSGFKIQALSVRMANTTVDTPVPIPVNALQTQLVLHMFHVHSH